MNMMRRIRNSVIATLFVTFPTFALASTPSNLVASRMTAAVQPDSSKLSDEEKQNRARVLYLEAEGLAEGGEWAMALAKYEEAYYLVPAKHGFAHKIGVAAWEIRDCVKAKQYLEHLIKYGSGEEKLAERVEDAKDILAEIKEDGCAKKGAKQSSKQPKNSSPNPEDAGSPNAVVPGDTQAPAFEENPLSMSRRDERNAQAEEEIDHKRRELRPYLIGGLAASVVGLGGLITGLVTLSKANKTADDLIFLSDNTTTGTQYPRGDYACRDDSQKCAFVLEKRLKQFNLATPIALGAGSAFLIGGAALVIWDLKKHKNQGEEGRAARLYPLYFRDGFGAGASIRF